MVYTGTLTSFEDWPEFSEAFESEAKKYGIWKNIDPATRDANPWQPNPGLQPDYSAIPPLPPVPQLPASLLEHESGNGPGATSTDELHFKISMMAYTQKLQDWEQDLGQISGKFDQALKIWEREDEAKKKLWAWMKMNVSPWLLAGIQGSEVGDPCIAYDAICKTLDIPNVINIDKTPPTPEIAELYNTAMRSLASPPATDLECLSWIARWKANVTLCKEAGHPSMQHSAIWFKDVTTHATCSMVFWVVPYSVMNSDKIAQNLITPEDVCDHLSASFSFSSPGDDPARCISGLGRLKIPPVKSNRRASPPVNNRQPAASRAPASNASGSNASAPARPSQPAPAKSKPPAPLPTRPPPSTTPNPPRSTTSGAARKRRNRERGIRRQAKNSR